MHVINRFSSSISLYLTASPLLKESIPQHDPTTALFHGWGLIYRVMRIVRSSPTQTIIKKSPEVFKDVCQGLYFLFNDNLTILGWKFNALSSVYYYPHVFKWLAAKFLISRGLILQLRWPLQTFDVMRWMTLRWSRQSVWTIGTSKFIIGPMRQHLCRIYTITYYCV